MKNYDETINTVFERIDNYKINQKRKRKAISQITVSTFGVCLAVAVGIFAFKGDMFNETPIVSDNTVGSISSKTDQQPQSLPNKGEDIEDNQSDPDGSFGGAVDNDTADVIGLVVIDGIQYVQFSVEETLFTPDKYIGDARDFDGTYKSHINDITAELYTVKESKDVLIVKLGNGGTVVLGRDGNISVNGKTYNITGIDPTQYVKDEFLGTADEFEIIEVPHREKHINEKDEIWSIKDRDDVLLLKKTDGNWAVLY